VKLDRTFSEALLAALPPPPASRPFRLGLCGPPGVGKSTLVESLGCHLTSLGHRVAVLAVDPSSSLSGGSILGDKTRMLRLSNDPSAFVRPSPTRGVLGGLARRTEEALLLCEAAGYDVCLLETVGVGQSEIAVTALVDMTAMLVAPAGGDGLQGIKRGLLELADVVLVNKADGELLPIARSTLSDYLSALSLFRPKFSAWQRKAMLCSGLEGGESVAEFWEVAQEFAKVTHGSGELVEHRRKQRLEWLWSAAADSLVEETKRQHPEAVGQIERAVADEEILAAVGSARLARLLGGGDA